VRFRSQSAIPFFLYLGAFARYPDAVIFCGLVCNDILFRIWKNKLRLSEGSPNVGQESQRCTALSVFESAPSRIFGSMMTRREVMYAIESLGHTNSVLLHLNLPTVSNLKGCKSITVDLKKAETSHEQSRRLSSREVEHSLCGRPSDFHISHNCDNSICESLGFE
jgi:hypothetical protein